MLPSGTSTASARPCKCRARRPRAPAAAGCGPRRRQIAQLFVGGFGIAPQDAANLALEGLPCLPTQIVGRSGKLEQCRGGNGPRQKIPSLRRRMRYLRPGELSLVPSIQLQRERRPRHREGSRARAAASGKSSSDRLPRVPGDVEVLLQLAEQLGLFDAVDAQVRFQIGIQVDHFGRIAGLLDHEVDQERFELAALGGIACSGMPRCSGITR